jgi:mRNA interferase MazF
LRFLPNGQVKKTKKHMAHFNRGDVVVVPFPYSDQLAEKRRPALVISTQEFSSTHGLVWVAMITSAKNPRWGSDIELPESFGGLPTASVIRIAKVATLDADRILRVTGQADEKTLSRVSAAITKVTVTA